MCDCAYPCEHYPMCQPPPDYYQCPRCKSLFQWYDGDRHDVPICHCSGDGIEMDPVYEPSYQPNEDDQIYEQFDN